MDCIEFKKKIDNCIAGKLSDYEFNDFLNHRRSCPACNEEFEVNYIVQEGINILDEDRADYDLSKAYEQEVSKGERYITFRKHTLIVRYVVATLCFWTVMAAVVRFVSYFGW